MNRRSLILSGVASAAIPNLAQAFIDCEPIRYGELQYGLEMSFWRPVGPQDREATAYALVAPWCPRCRELILAAQAGQLPLNLRLVPTFERFPADRQKIWDLIVHDADEAIDAFHDRRPTKLSEAEPASIGTLADIAAMTLQACSIWNGKIYGSEVNATPAVVIFKEYAESETGTIPEIVLGYAPDIIPVYEELARPIVSSGGPFPKSYLLEQPAIENFRGRNVSTGPDRGQARVLPHRQALVAQCYGGGRDLRMTLGTQMVLGEEWFVARTSDGKSFFMSKDDYTEFS